MNKNAMTVRDLMAQLLQMDMDAPVYTHNPKPPETTGTDDEDGAENRGIVIDADDTAPALYATETANGVVISEMKPAD